MSPPNTDELDGPNLAMVRKARREMAEACGNDLKTLLAELRRMEREHPAREGTPRGKGTRPPRG